MNKTSALTKFTAHRPWPLPSGPWVMTQRWLDLLFAHWPIPAQEMQALLPPQLVLDTFENDAWVGVVPFRMENVRPRWVPALPWLSAFPEFNIRTYVRAPDSDNPKPGVYFFSLDAANPVAVAIARSLFLLPYFNAQMSLDAGKDEADYGQQQEYQSESIQYRSHRTHRDASPADFVGAYGPNGPVYHAKPNTLEHWLTERYCLYSIGRKGQLYRGDIHHKPWPLQPAFADISVNTMAAASGINLPTTEPLLHFAKKIDVVVWPIQRVN